MLTNKGPVSTLAVIVCAVTVALYGALVALLAENPYWAPAALIGLCVAAITLLRPMWGLYLFLAAMFFEGVLILEAGITVARLLGILVFGAWIARSLSGGRVQIALPKPALFAVAYVVWGTMSLVWATDPQLVLEWVQMLGQSVALYIMMINLVSTPRRAQNVLALIVVASLISAFLIGVRVVSRGMADGRVDIAGISSYGPNNQAAYLLLGAATLMVRFVHEAKVGKKLMLLSALVVIVLSVLATVSRGAMVSLAAMLACGLVLDRRLWQVVVPALLIGLIALLLFPSTVTARIESIVTLSDRGSGRLDIWSVGLHIFADHPILGVGWGNFARTYDRYLFQTPGLAQYALLGMGPHNDFLGTLGELGVIGFGLFTTMIVLTARGALTAVLESAKGRDLRMRTLTTSVLLGLVGLLVASMFVDLRYRKFFWVLLACTVAVQRLSSMPKGGAPDEGADSGS